MAYVAGLFSKKGGGRRFVVVDHDDKLIGVLTRKDILRAIRVMGA